MSPAFSSELNLLTFIEKFTQIRSDKIIQALKCHFINGENYRQSGIKANIDPSGVRANAQKITKTLKLIGQLNVTDTQIENLTKQQLLLLLELTPTHSGNEVYDSVIIWHKNQAKGLENELHLLNHSYIQFYKAKVRLSDKLTDVTEWHS